MEHFENPPVTVVNQLIVTENIKDHLRTASAWAKFLAIFGFIVTLFIVLGAIGIFLFRDNLPLRPDFGPNYGGSTYGYTPMFAFVPLLIMAIVYFLISLFLYRFAVHAKQAVMYNHQDDLLASSGNLKSYFKTIGIVVIIAIVFYVFAIIAAIGMFTMFNPG